MESNGWLRLRHFGLQEAKVREDRLEKWLACVPGYESFWAFSQNKKGYSGERQHTFVPVEY